MNTAPKSWHDVIAIHPAAELFPLMSPAELRELGENIKKHGLRAPITIVEKDGVQVHKDMQASDYVLLDGRNRLDAMELVGIPFELVYGKLGRGSRTKRWDIVLPEDISDLGFNTVRLSAIDDPYDYVLSLNLHRRHLTLEQRRDLVAKVLKAKPELSNRQIAAMTAFSHPFVGKVRNELERTGDVETVSTSIDTRGRRQPRSREPVEPEPQSGLEGGMPDLPSTPARRHLEPSPSSSECKPKPQDTEICPGCGGQGWVDLDPAPRLNSYNWFAATDDERAKFVCEVGLDRILKATPSHLVADCRDLILQILNAVEAMP
jgi:hypothetical protein